MLAAVSITAWPGLFAWLHACAVAVTVAVHLHAGFRSWSRVTTISTVRPTVRECCTHKGTGSHKGRSTKDHR
jgi:hypothetical protein